MRTTFLRRALVRSTAAGAAALIVVSMVTAAVIPPTRGIVTGRIQACRALDYAGAEEYSSGTVSVYRGDVRWELTDAPQLSYDIRPKVLVAEQSVPAGGFYRFDLDPGHYLLQANTAGSTSLYTEFMIGAGDDLSVDIFNGCI